MVVFTRKKSGKITGAYRVYTLPVFYKWFFNFGL